jgi:hypothetical protein
MVLGDGFARLEFAVVEVQPPVLGGTAGGDVCISVAVRFDSFAGAINAWIRRED